jgi:Leucine-rich repeat (LRR) protein
MLSTAELRKARTFKSLKIASARPNDVYKFTLRGSTTNIATVPNDIKALKNLQSLDLSSCPLRSLPDWIGEFPNLQVLKISETSIAALPASIANLTNLEELDASFNTDLKFGLEHLFTLKSLKKLNFQVNDTLPESIINLTNLENLFINELTNSHNLSFLYNLTRLKRLEICGDMLTILPNGISALTQLETFIMVVTPVVKLPDDFSELTKLKEFGYTGLYNIYLDNHENPDFKIDVNWAQIFTELSKIKTLQSVDLSDNCIKKYDENLGLLTQVKKLIFNDMVRKTTDDPYPKSFSNLKNLKELSISDRDLVFETVKNMPLSMPNVKVVAK